jgi:peroxiredoxin
LTSKWRCAMKGNTIRVGDRARDFTLVEAGSDLPRSLSEFTLESNVVLLFYRGVW